METMDVVLTVPTLNELFGWLVFYLCLGNVVQLIGCFFVVWSDYGRSINRRTTAQSFLIAFRYWFFWPLAIPVIILNATKFNRNWET